MLFIRKLDWQPNTFQLLINIKNSSFQLERLYTETISNPISEKFKELLATATMKQLSDMFCAPTDDKNCMELYEALYTLSLDNLTLFEKQFNSMSDKLKKTIEDAKFKLKLPSITLEELCDMFCDKNYNQRHVELYEVVKKLTLENLISFEKGFKSISDGLKKIIDDTKFKLKLQASSIEELRFICRDNYKERSAEINEVIKKFSLEEVIIFEKTFSSTTSELRKTINETLEKAI